MAKHKSGKGRHRRTAARKRKATIARMRKAYRLEIEALTDRVRLLNDSATDWREVAVKAIADVSRLTPLLTHPWAHLWKHLTGKLRTESKKGGR